MDRKWDIELIRYGTEYIFFKEPTAESTKIIQIPCWRKHMKTSSSFILRSHGTIAGWFSKYVCFPSYSHEFPWISMNSHSKPIENPLLLMVNTSISPGPKKLPGRLQKVGRRPGFFPRCAAGCGGTCERCRLAWPEPSKAKFGWFFDGVRPMRTMKAHESWKPSWGGKGCAYWMCLVKFKYLFLVGFHMSQDWN